MSEPIYINPNIKPQPGGGEESLAASSAMIVSGIEKDLNIKKAGKVIEDKKAVLEELDKYIQKLSETTMVEPLKKRGERREEKKEELLDKRPQKKDNRNSSRKSAKAFEWLNRKIVPPPKTIVLKAGDKDSYKAMLDPDTFKQYLTLHLKTAIGIPKEEREQNRAALSSLELKLKGAKQDDFINRTRTELNKIISGEISRAIKASLLRKLSREEGLAEWLIESKRSGNILNYALYNEATEGLDKYTASSLLGKALKADMSKKWGLRSREPRELADLAEEAGVDLLSWISSFINERIVFGSDGSVVIDTKLIENEWKKSLLFDEFKMLHIDLIMEEGLIKGFLINSRIKKVAEGLIELEAKGSELTEARSQARKIAWAKMITELREAHLARVLTASEDEFVKNSKKISTLTKRARRIGAGFYEKGLKFVAAKLELMALDTANYKLELLKSMQSLEYDKSREKEISWLDSTRQRLKGAEERVEFWERIARVFAKAVGK